MYVDSQKLKYYAVNTRTIRRIRTPVVSIVRVMQRKLVFSRKKIWWPESDNSYPDNSLNYLGKNYPTQVTKFFVLATFAPSILVVSYAILYAFTANSHNTHCSDIGKERRDGRRKQTNIQFYSFSTWNTELDTKSKFTIDNKQCNYISRYI